MHRLSETHGQRLAWATVLGIGLFAACVESPDDSTASEDHFPDVGLGCQAERTGPDEWRVICPTDDSAIPMVDGSTALEDVDVIDAELPVFDEGAPPEPDAALVESDLGIPDCDPPLSLTSPVAAVSPHELLRVRAEGGTGAWHFELVDNQSGALINEATGAYLAGGAIGTVDRARVSDSACLGEAFLDIRVVDPMEVVPLAPEVERLGTLLFEPSKGSGEYALELLTNRSGAELIEPMTYRAGDRLATDTVHVIDVGTGERIQVQIHVLESVQIEVAPPVVYLPVGADGQVSIEGGSGVYEFEAAQGIRWENGIFVGDTPGTYPVRITDRNADRFTDFVVSVVGSLQAESRPLNDHWLSERIKNAGDLNGDGMDDIVLVQAESDAAAVNGGVLLVYLSEDGTYGPDPTQVFTSDTRGDELGRGVDLADVNGDGLLDLVYGIRLSDGNGVNSGSLMIHLGQPGGLFAEEPGFIINGPQNDAQFGFSVAICDFNGDDFPDLAVGSYAYEDRDPQPPSWNQGAVVLHLGYEDGFLHRADQIIPGRVPDEAGQWVHRRDLYLGRAMAAGDFDGDGLCDLAVTSMTWAYNGNSGLVFLHRGQQPSGLSPGGLSESPTLWFGPDLAVNQSGEFGRRIAMGDVNGDGRADLLVGQNAADEAGPNSGAVHLFTGRSFENAGPGEQITSAEADWSKQGTNWDHFGMEVQIVDVDGVPPLDVLVSALYDDIDNRWDSGSTFVYSGVQGDVPSADPSVIFSGPEQSFRLGVATTAVGDTNDDGRPDFISMSHYGGTDYPHLGRPFFVRSTTVEIPPEPVEEGDEAGLPVIEETYELLPLNMPRSNSGARFGTDVSFVGDVDGDGWQDAMVTSTEASHPEVGIRSGELWFYRGTPEGIPPEGERVPMFVGHSQWDLLRGVEGIGDFDGDGHDDFVLLLGHDERPNEFGENYAVQDSCTPRLHDQGGAYIFLGGPEKFDFEPDFVHWGLGVNLATDMIRGGYDFNGDDLSDIAIGTWRRDVDGRNDTGSITILAGRADPHPGQITVICDPTFEHFGRENGDHLGYALAFMNDLNGDGCDELAIGVRLANDNGFQNGGGAQIMYGFGAQNCLPGPHFARLNADIAWIQMGTSLAAGDLDGDGLDELAISAPYARVNEAARGATWVLPGTFLSGITPLPWAQAVAQPPHWVDQSHGNRMIGGMTEGGEAGRGLFIAGDLVGITEVNDYVAGQASVSTVRLYRLQDSGEIDDTPVALVIGETQRPGSRMGEHLGLSVSPDGQMLIVGATLGSGTGPDNGSAYTLDLSLLSR